MTLPQLEAQHEHERLLCTRCYGSTELSLLATFCPHYTDLCHSIMRFFKIRNASFIVNCLYYQFFLGVQKNYGKKIRGILIEYHRTVVPRRTVKIQLYWSSKFKVV